MALIVSAATGNFNAGATWVGGVVPTIGDEARASNLHTITITANASCDEVSNAGTGKFVINEGVTLTANVTSKSTTLNSHVLEFTANLPAQAYIAGNCVGGTSNGTRAVSHNSTGTLNITGNCTGGSVNSNCFGAINNSTGTLNITGNVVSGVGSACHGVQNAGSGLVLVTGNATGSSGASAYGANNSSTGTLNITGIATGGSIATSAGVNNASTGVVNLGRAKGNAYGPGNTSGLAASVGALNTGIGIIEIEQLEYGTYGMSPTSGTGIRLKKANTNVAVFNYCDTAGAKTLVDATQGQMPAASDVRSGVSYASGALSGSCAVPAAGSVALGVAVDATTGTAVLTPEAVWGAATRTLTAGGGISASDVWDYATRSLTTSSGPTAVQIRQEMDSNSAKLANLDATISSRSTLTTGDLPSVPSAASVASAVRTELTEISNLDATVSSRLASSAYSAAPTTAQIATAVEGSLLNEADGQAVLNAIVGAIGNTNLSEVSLVAAVRADLERTGGKIDSIPTTAAPTAVANATAVWATASKTITGGTVDTLTNSPSVPSAASIAAATRSELAVELARVDASVSSRLAGSAYTAPANSDVAAIKVKTDALNTERLANVATTAIVGNLIAQANS